MKFKIKSISILLAVSLLSVYFTGCTSKNEDTQANSIGFEYTVTEEGIKYKMPNAPIMPAWFPDQLLQWDFKDILNDINKSSVALVERVSKDKIYPVNDKQNKETDVVALSIMNSSTSGNIPHGTNEFSSNTFSYWQYIDKMIYWGGSSGEGIIVPPTPDVTDSAHKNGVPVLGTVFFAPVEYGGKTEWLDQFLTKDQNGNFPMVDKLIEACNVYGFDGWFINQETNPSGEEIIEDYIKKTEQQNEEVTEKETSKQNYADLFKEFLKQFKEKAGDNLEIMWYDSMTNDGNVDWQNALNSSNQQFVIDENKNLLANSMFLNFWWTSKKLADQQLLKSSKAVAESIGYNPKALFAGIDVQANGTATPIRWDLLEDGEKDTYTSIGLYCPSWTFSSSNGDFDQFQDKEGSLWVNEHKDPSKITTAKDTEWRGISTYVTERTVVNTTPFKTNFNIGNGYNFFINGEKISKLDWNNRSLADVMPTYRWIIQSEGDVNSVKPSIDYANAYYGGNSIKLLSNLKQNVASYIKLFSADLKIEQNTNFTVYAMADSEVELNLRLEFHDGTDAIIKADKKLSPSWSNISFDLNKYIEKEIASISFEIISNEEKTVNINLGGISIDNGQEYNKIDISEVTVEDVMFAEDDTLAGVNLSWESSSKDGLKAYEIYSKNDDGTLSFLGATLNNKFFINALQRKPNTMETEFVVMAVNQADERGQTASTLIQWPDNTVPKANFKASKTLVAPNEEITFTNMSNSLSEEFEWKFEGADIATSTEENPTIKYDKEGTYTVSLTAKNAKGVDEIIKEELIVVTEKAKNGLTNLSLNKPTEASSFVNPNEAPEFAVDGDSSKKWCAVGTDKHNITIDLGEVKQIAEVAISHAEEGGESPDMNTEEYMVEVSEDGTNFTEVVNVSKNSLGKTIDAFKPINARFVKLTVLKPTQGSDSAARIYEIEVFGLE